MQDCLQPYKLSFSEASFLSLESFFRKQTSPKEVLLITKFVRKINNRNREQERVLAISNENIYNLSGKSIKRKIHLKKVYACTVSRSSFEFILHIPEEYDYRYKSIEFRDIILQYLCVALHMNGLPLQIYFVDQDDLEQFTLHDKTANKAQQIALHPKVPLVSLYPDQFQLQYINRINKQLTVLYAASPTLLRVQLVDYQKNVIIGSGSLCKTVLVTQKKQDNSFVVLKTINRNEFDIDIDLMEFLLKTYQQEPFITPLELCVQQGQKVHFFFKFMRGGDLFQHLRDVNVFSESSAKLIFSQIAMALSALHERGVIYGDLKPENVLLDERGYAYLTDFGYGKLRIYQMYKSTKQMCVTLDYCPPEYLKNKELTRMSDWYCLGVLLYELVVGITPFYNKSQQITIQMILAGELHFPKTITADCRSMIHSLMHVDTSQRIGFANDFKEIQAHPWLNDVQWNDLKAKRIDLPYQPVVDVQSINESYFSMEQLNEEQRIW